MVYKFFQNPCVFALKNCFEKALSQLKDKLTKDESLRQLPEAFVLNILNV